MSDEINIPEEPLHNEETRRSFKRQVSLQIYLPIGAALLVLIGLAVGFSLGEVGSFSLWADISLMLLIIPALILGVLFLALTAALVYGVTWLIGAVPQPAFQVQKVFSEIARRSKTAADGLAAPVIRISALNTLLRPGSRKSSRAAQGETHE